MTPQSNFMVVAPVTVGRVDELRILLSSMNDRPGMAKPDNPIVPFGRFHDLHYARFVILDDHTLNDFVEFGAPVPDFAVLLAFLGDCDGPAEDFLADIARRCEGGLRHIFSFCQGFTPNSDLLRWMQEHSRPPAAAYVNWVGRTVRQVREEAALRRALVDHLKDHLPDRDEPQSVRDDLLAFVRREQSSGRLTLTPAAHTPLGWRVRSLLHFAIIPGALLLPWVLAIPFLIPLPKHFFWIVIPFLVLSAAVFLWLIRVMPVAFAVLVALGLLLFPFFILFPLLLIPLGLFAVLFLSVLRHYEKSEREVIHRPEVDHILRLAALEDHDVTNQFTALGSVKPSGFRRWLFAVILWLIDYFARHVYTRGHLGRIRSIHFARWVFLDGKKRMVFASNYDGSHEAYMDDFINKVGWALNLAFTSGLGYPRTNWLIKDGADDELKFKYTQRRHQQPTDTWYRAYPGLTTFDLARNTRVREGIEQHTMTDAEIGAWLRDL
jgi:hypothetical protein